jgi:glutamine cyclotransferase
MAKHLTSTACGFAAKPAPVQTFKIIESFSHDVSDYTDGLFFHDGFLYEATGEFGKSRLKKSPPAWAGKPRSSLPEAFELPRETW